jgi:hypothetical protein
MGLSWPNHDAEPDIVHKCPVCGTRHTVKLARADGPYRILSGPIPGWRFS